MVVQLGPTKLTYPGLWGYGQLEGYPLKIDVYGNLITTSIFSPFGPRTPIVTPAGTTGSFHYGIDLPAPAMTPISCPAPGVVAYCGIDLAGAHVIIVRLEDGSGIQFLHMEANAPMAGFGQVLNRGDFIGFVGTTGLSTGNHLHLGRLKGPILDNSNWYDPADFIDPLGPDGGFTEVIDTVFTTPTPAPTTTIPTTTDPNLHPSLLFFYNQLLYLEKNPPVDWPTAIKELQKQVLVIGEALNA